MIIWSVYDGSEYERHFVQLEVCDKFPPAPDRDEVALWEDAVAASQHKRAQTLQVEQAEINEHHKPHLFNTRWRRMNIPCV